MKETWKIFGVYMLIIVFMLFCEGAFGQIKIIHFNASWNSANDVGWLGKLSDCKTISYIDIAKNVEAQKEYKISAVPTIIMFKDNEEVKRFQADLSFKMVATREEVQEEIDNQLMSDF
jgi:uncharacterized protein (DUF2235 family)